MAPAVCECDDIESVAPHPLSRQCVVCTPRAWRGLGTEGANSQKKKSRDSIARSKRLASTRDNVSYLLKYETSLTLGLYSKWPNGSEI